MLKGSSAPVHRLRRFFSSVRCPPGGGVVSSAEVIPSWRSTLRRPPSVKRRSVPGNWCSFIGQIVAPVRPNQYSWGASALPNQYSWGASAFTFLEVKGPLRNQTTSPFQICISMKGDLAQVALQYLQQKQYIFVSGCLYSYNKIHSSYPRHVHYSVAVQELNFVRTHSQNEVPCKTNDELKKEEVTFAASTTDSGSCYVNKEDWARERHILWQIFFANPFEWWDQRARKRTPKHPDFKHKSTGEVLWIRSDDPPWVKKQLNLYDSQISDTNLFQKDDYHGLQGWKMNDFDHL